MDACIEQLYGLKNFTFSADECEHLELLLGDVLYLPMGTRHHAWTEGSLSELLNVFVESQFVVWGALLSASACGLLLDARAGSALQPFGMEGETRLSRALQSLAEQNGAPRLLRTPDALACGVAARPPPTRRRCTTSGRRPSTRRAPPHGWRTTTAPSTSRAQRRAAASVSALLDELAAAPDAATRAALDWADELLRRHLRASMLSH